jgi:hypothetical protein
MHPNMHPKNLFVVICLFTGIWIGGTPSQAETDRPLEAQILAQNVPSQRTQPRNQGRDWSQLVIRAQDLPSGFQGMPADQLNQLRQELTQDGLSIGSVFAFMEPKNFEMLIGVTTPLQSPQEQNDFEAILASPGALQRMITEGMGATQILQQTPLRLENIGEAVAGVNLKLNMEGVPANLDIVAFRRDAIGAFVFLLYLEGQIPQRPIANLARTLDNRAKDILGAPN